MELYTVQTKSLGIKQTAVLGIQTFRVDIKTIMQIITFHLLRLRIMPSICSKPIPG